MNSSGIKRGLATTAVSALAIAGIPFIASSASASTTEMTVGFAGPARDNGSEGAYIVLNIPEQGAAGGVQNVIAADRFKAIKSDFTGVEGGQNNATQTITVLDAQPVAEGSELYGSKTGTDEYVVNVRVDTNPTGATADFGLFIDEAGATGNDAVDAADLRTRVQVQTAGAPTQVTVDPASQSAPQGVESGDYTVKVFDSAGRPTQLNSGETIDVDPRGTDGTDVGAGRTAGVGNTLVLDADDLEPGETTFTATSTEAPTLHFIDIVGNITGAGTPASARTVATLNVTAAGRALQDNEVDLVSGADDWDGFGDNSLNGTTVVRVDQTSITLNIRDLSTSNPKTNAGATISASLDGAGVTFAGGKDMSSVSTTLNGQGEGQLVITPDAGTIQDGDSFTVTGLRGGATLTVVFDRAELTSVAPEAQTYVSQVRGSVDITVVARDQFGNPVAGAYVDAQRSGANNDANPTAKKITDANGEATFTFTDAAAGNGSTDTVTFRAFEDQFATAFDTGTATIRYSTTGTGNDFVLSADGNVGGASTYNPANVITRPLVDGTIDGAAIATNDEYIELVVSNATVGAPLTVSADNGALVLRNTEDRLSQGAASDTVTAGATNTFRIVGTKVGLTTVTVASAGVTKTIQFTVQSVNPNTTLARNVSVEGPESAVSGDTVEFTAMVGDAFGNPVAGVRVTDLNIQVQGPARLQDTDAVTDANGELAINIRLDDDADSPVGVRVTGIPSTTGANQFGAAANQETSTSAVNSAPGIDASSNIASATVDNVTNLEELEQAVEDAEVALARAEAGLAAAQADLDVAQTQLAIAQAEVDRLQERKQNLRQKLNKAKANDNKKKAKTTRKKLRSVKSQLRDARQAAEVAQTAVEGEQAVVAEAQQAVTQAEEALAQAQADLDEAQN